MEMIDDGEAFVDFLRDHGVLVCNSHIVHSSGEHGTVFFDKDALFPNPIVIRTLAHQIARRFPRPVIDAVVGPAVTGVALAHGVASVLSSPGRTVLAAFADRNAAGRFVFRRTFERLLSGRRVLLVDDSVNSGRSIAALQESVLEARASVSGIAVVCDRYGVAREWRRNGLDVSIIADITFDYWQPAECPLCARGVPINTQVGGCGP